MISWYIVLGHQRITANAHSLFNPLFLLHHERIYACHMEQRQKTTTFDVCYLLFSIYVCICEHISLSSLVSLLCICTHIISLKRKFDVNVLQCDTTHHHRVWCGMKWRAKGGTSFFVFHWCSIFIGNAHSVCTAIRIRICYSKHLCVHVHTQRNIVQHNIYLVMPHAAYCYHHYLHLFMDSLRLYGFEWWFWFQCKQFTYNYIPCKSHSLPTHRYISLAVSHPFNRHKYVHILSVRMCVSTLTAPKFDNLLICNM